jgi:hypothetical protein
MKSREQAGLSWNSQTLRYERSTGRQIDEFMNLRIEQMRQRALEFRPLILSARIFGPNNGSRKKAAHAAAFYKKVFGKPTLKERAKSFALVCFATIEWLRIRVRRLFGRGEIVRQPLTCRVDYNMECSPYSPVEAPEIASSLQHSCNLPS